MGVCEHGPFRGVPLARHLEDVRGGHETPDRHLTYGQSTRLVGTHDLGTAEGFDRRQPPDQGSTPCHALHAERERDGHNRGKPLRDGRHGKAHGAHEQLERRDSAQQAEAEDEGHDREASYKKAAAQLVELLLERCVPGRGGLEKRGDAPELGRHARRHDDGTPGAAHDTGPEEDRVPPLGDGYIGRAQACVLVDRLRFPSEHRLDRA